MSVFQTLWPYMPGFEQVIDSCFITGHTAEGRNKNQNETKSKTNKHKICGGLTENVPGLERWLSSK